MKSPRVIVVGAGISGMTAALMAHEAGADVTIITFGFGGLQLSQGTIDILDVPQPLDSFGSLPETHPYHLISADSVRDGIDAFRRYVPAEGSAEESSVFPTAIGALRRTALYPASMADGRIIKGDNTRFHLVGFSGLKDFYPALAAENLSNLGIPTRSSMLPLAAPGDTALAYSRSLAEPGAARGLGTALAALAEPDEHIGIPAVVREDLWREIREAARQPVFQIPLPPPSVPGLEINERLRAACQDARIRMYLNAKATGLDITNGEVSAVHVAVAGSTKHISTDAVIYAAGGLDSGAIELDSHGTLHDTAFDLPVAHADHLVHGDYSGDPQPLFASGLRVDPSMRVLDGESVVSTNLYAVGGMLAGAYRAREKSGEGIALGSAAQAVASMMRSQA